MLQQGVLGSGNLRIRPTCARASRRSADWCIKAVDTCWNAKQGRIRENERVEAKLAYGRAKSIYEKIKAECVAE